MSLSTHDLPPAYQPLPPQYSTPSTDPGPAEASSNPRSPRPPSTTHSRPVPVRTIVKSARYPRVAVLLGIPKKWFVPLLLCRSTSTLFALWWTSIMASNVWALVRRHDDQGVSGRVKMAPATGSARVMWEEVGEGRRLEFRLMSAQLGLAFLWALTAAYLSHLFAASLMSRWLQYYSPFAVLVRLCSLNVLLSYGFLQLFGYMDILTVNPSTSVRNNLAVLSASLPVWIFVSVALLVGYFLTQQDISVESGEDDRRRRLILRMKCFAALSVTSLVSLMVLIMVIRIGDCEADVDWNDLTGRYRSLLYLLPHMFQQSGHDEL